MASVLFAPGSWPRYVLSAIFFVITCMGMGIAALLILVPSTILYVFSKRAYREILRWAMHLLASWMVLITWALAGPVEFVVSGDWDKLSKEDQVVMMSNHQTYTDWWWIGLLAHMYCAQGTLYIILMNFMIFIPIIGQIMYLSGFIFLKQSWKKDKKLVQKRLQGMKAVGLPYWLLIFPEGTLNTPPGKKMSHEFAVKTGISPEPVHVLLPRSTGLQFCCNKLRPELSALYDITIGYSGIAADEVPYYKHLPTTVFFSGTGPRRVHFHIKRLDLDRIPGISFGESRTSNTSSSNEDALKRGNSESTLNENHQESFNTWLRERFYVKDKQMVTFFDYGEFMDDTDSGFRKENSVSIKIKPTVWEWLSVITAILLVWFIAGAIFYAIAALIMYLV
ncbi:hypothetical protein SmJEL517_g05352 [Synchytrium microbalum]|uniref:Phospholipid/glycerol acyltransferase domain-containing protein n=1 Tax=Synchytrium microbalum TaxID=1806994 RepID=A0A507BWP1_9FUNG|nr:uncharacterized protein SmJEL517_g05352 [Synchytrium microbalum]TPX31299.1 hypothetical protein SmJEL517_g05352 [Synchytrium microbalum]